jgi:hypothetical protein
MTTPVTSVADDRGRRLDASTGIVATIVVLAGFLVQTQPPDPGDPVQKIASYLSDHRSSILAGDVLIGIAVAIFIWWLGSLRSYLRAGEGGEGRLSAAAFLGGGVSLAVLGAGAALQSALVLHPDGLGNPTVVRVGFDGYNALVTMAGAPLAVLIAAASCSGARSGALPPSAYWGGSIVAGLQIATLAALFTKHGFFAAGKDFTLIAFLGAAAWFIAISLLMIRRRGIPPVARATP